MEKAAFKIGDRVIRVGTALRGVVVNVSTGCGPADTCVRWDREPTSTWFQPEYLVPEFKKGDPVVTTPGGGYYSLNTADVRHAPVVLGGIHRSVDPKPWRQSRGHYNPTTNTFAIADVKTAAPSVPVTPGWSFSATAADFDGPRVLKELAEAGADYAVVSWGEEEGQGIAFVSARCRDRAKRTLEVACFPASSFSLEAHTSDGPGAQFFEAMTNEGALPTLEQLAEACRTPKLKCKVEYGVSR